jgi:hypothetical protein
MQRWKISVELPYVYPTKKVHHYELTFFVVDEFKQNSRAYLPMENFGKVSDPLQP